MAKKSKIANNNKKIKCIEIYSDRRKKLKRVLSDNRASIQERYEAQVSLMKLPRNSCKVRHNNICSVTGKPRAFYRYFGVCRNVVRELSSFGLLPGVIKSSW